MIENKISETKLIIIIGKIYLLNLVQSKKINRIVKNKYNNAVLSPDRKIMIVDIAIKNVIIKLFLKLFLKNKIPKIIGNILEV